MESIIKADAEKAKAKAEAEKKLAKDVKIAAEKLKNQKEKTNMKTIKEITGKSVQELLDEEEKQKKKTSTGDKEKEKSGEDSEETDAEAKIKELTETMDKMTKEIDALKKRKNYRMKPPPADKVDEVDDFIKQNITKDFEVII